MSTEKFESLVSADWLAANLQHEQLRVLDVTRYIDFQPGQAPVMRSGRPEWEAGHIPGALYIDLTEELSDLSSPYPTMLPKPEAFAQKVGELGIGDDHHLVVYSAGEIWWSTRAWWMFKTMGFDRVSVLDGGLHAWEAAGFELSSKRPDYPSASFTPYYRPQMVADKNDVLAALTDEKTAVINALWADHHSGEKDYGYARRGRIAGSRNIPFDALLDPETACFLPLDRLEEIVGAVLTPQDEKKIIYCGGAIAATLDAFVLHQLGVKGVAVYDASLREWAADDSLPMEVDR